MSPAPCGCDLAQAAEKHPDKRGRDVLETDAKAARARWNCVYSGARVEGRELDAGCIRAIDGVSRLIGAKLPRDRCPGMCGRGVDAHRVTELKEWRDAGQLQLLMPRVPRVYEQAINALTQGLKAREAYELDEIARKAEANGKGGHRAK
jgi:hypothetical protein